MSQNINYCQVLDCESNKDIRTFTPGAKKKSEEKETLTIQTGMLKKKISNFYQTNLSDLLKNKNDNSSNNFENWSDIKVDMANDKPNLTKDNFDLLLQKISNMESELNVYRNNQI
ncbi:14500_t:CDS:2, partial [Entrophospora sp. SA101]